MLFHPFGYDIRWWTHIFVVVCAIVEDLRDGLYRGCTSSKRTVMKWRRLVSIIKLCYCFHFFTDFRLSKSEQYEAYYRLDQRRNMVVMAMRFRLELAGSASRLPYNFLSLTVLLTNYILKSVATCSIYILLCFYCPFSFTVSCFLWLLTTQ